MKIGYFQTAFLGDLLLSIPTLRWIHREQPEAELILFCRIGLGPLMEKLPFVHQAIEVNKKNADSRKIFEKNLPQMPLDILLCPHQSLRSHRWIRKIQATKKIGFSRWWNAPFFDHRVSRPLQLHDALRQMMLLSPIFPEAESFLQPFLEYGKLGTPVPGEASMTMPKKFWLESGLESLSIPREPFVCLAPGSVWATKRWTPKGFSEVGHYLKKQGYKVLFMGSPDETSLCEELAGEIGGVSLAGKLSLWEVAQFLSQAKLMVSNDSGGQHLASLAGTPTVSIFGPTVLSLGYSPWQNQARVVEESDLKCRPCGKHGHQKCPIGTHACMERISAQRVIAEAQSILAFSKDT